MTGKAQIITPDRSDARIAKCYEVFSYLRERFGLNGFTLLWYVYDGDYPAVSYERTSTKFPLTPGCLGLCWYDEKKIFLNLRLIDNPVEMYFTLLHELTHARNPTQRERLGIDDTELFCDIISTVHLFMLKYVLPDVFRDEPDFQKKYEETAGKFLLREYGGYR